jgi:zinc protease
MGKFIGYGLAFVTLGLVGCIGMPHARAPSVASAVRYPLDSYDHPSGLRVVLESAPNYGIGGAVLRVDVGSADEASDQAGIAHLAEHLVFRSVHDGSSSLLARFDDLGVSTYNGMTSWDSTSYFAYLPEASLPELAATFLRVVADPLAQVTEADFEHELDIVRNELRSRAENGTPGQALGWLGGATFPSAHPYSHPVVGSESTLSSLTLAKVQAFVKAHYSAAKSTLVLSGASVGPGTRALVDQLAKQSFGEARAPHAALSSGLGSGPMPPELSRHEAPVPSPTLWLGWSLPGGPVEAGDIATLLSAMADEGFWSEVDERDADIGSTDAGNLEGTRGGLFFLSLKLNRGKDPQGSARAAARQLSRIFSERTHGASWFEGYKRHVAVASTYSQENSISRGLSLAASAAVYGDSTFLRRRPDRIIALSEDKVADFYTKYLSDDLVHPVLVMPTSSPAASAQSTASAIDTKAGAARTAPSPSVMQSWMLELGVDTAVTKRLDNGLEIVAIAKPGSPFHSVVLGFRSGIVEGLPPGTITAARYARQWLSLPPTVWGVSYSTKIFEDWMADTLRSTGTDVRFTLTQLDEAMAYPVSWPNPQFTSQLEVFRAEEAAPQALWRRAHEDALFGAHFYGEYATAAQARDIAAVNVYRYKDAIRRPDNAVLVIVGGMDPKAAVQTASEIFSPWQVPEAERPRVSAPTALEAVAKPHAGLRIQNQPGSSQATFRLSCLLPSSTAEAVASSEVFDELAGASLFGTLRERQRASYSVSHGVQRLRGGTTVFWAEADVDPARLPPALAALRRFVEPSSTDAPVDIGALELARGDVARGFNPTYGTSIDLAQGIVAYWKNEWPLSALGQLPQQVLAVEANDVLRLAAHCRANAVLSALGDERRIRDAWEQLPR